MRSPKPRYVVSLGECLMIVYIYYDALQVYLPHHCNKVYANHSFTGSYSRIISALLCTVTISPYSSYPWFCWISGETLSSIASSSAISSALQMSQISGRGSIFITEQFGMGVGTG